MDIQESILEGKYGRKLFLAFYSEQFSMFVGFNLTTSYLCLIIITYCKHAQLKRRECFNVNQRTWDPLLT